MLLKCFQTKIGIPKVRVVRPKNVPLKTSSCCEHLAVSLGLKEGEWHNLNQI